MHAIPASHLNDGSFRKANCLNGLLAFVARVDDDDGEVDVPVDDDDEPSSSAFKSLG